MNNANPPGHPGIAPNWTSSAKSGVGTSFPRGSRVWFTISNGIINEVYYPDVDHANTRDLQFLVSDGNRFFSEEKVHTAHEIKLLEQGVPAYRLINTCIQEKYRIVKTVLTDPYRNVLLLKVKFEPIQGNLENYHLYTILTPHINNHGYENNGFAGDYKGFPMLFAQREGISMALACSTPFIGMSCGYMGISDGWQDINAHKRMMWHYPRVTDGNIALTGEIDLHGCKGMFIMALAFGGGPAEAGLQAKAALLQDFDKIKDSYIRGWKEFQSKCYNLGEVNASGFDIYRVSTAVLATHESQSFQGGIVASLSIPWGDIKGDNDLGGYHLIWPRDLVEGAGGLLAAGDDQGARRTLFYLICTQEADGHWPQNMWLDGTPYWRGTQMDETAFPILLAGTFRRIGRLNGIDPWPMVRKAASFLVHNGPVTQEDRWEEDPGYSPFTLAVEVSALLEASDFAKEAGEEGMARYLQETADIWNDGIERWTYITDTELARRFDVEGYYVRLAPSSMASFTSPEQGFISIKNRPPDIAEMVPVSQVISPGALALVRFGLRSPHDPRITNTIKVIDTLLKTGTATGPVWHRYNLDGYGEHEDGSPYDGTGIGRGWPLLAGERAHYELAAGNISKAKYLLAVMEAQTSAGGLIPEQVWDVSDIPEKGLFSGSPSKSATPLMWAHAEYIKLRRSLHDGKVFDMPLKTVQRYQEQKVVSPFIAWRFNNKVSRIQEGKTLRVEALKNTVIRWSIDDWKSSHDTKAGDSGLRVYYADLPTDKLPVGSKVAFTFFWPEASKWEGKNFEVSIHDKAQSLSNFKRGY
ncbi:MAG: glycoside hydrolase family 15 protein [Methanotrichaceae archaeon]